VFNRNINAINYSQKIRIEFYLRTAWCATRRTLPWRSSSIMTGSRRATRSLETVQIESITVLRIADPGCLSRILDPDFYSTRDPGSRIPDPKTATKERCEKKFVVIPFFVATNLTKYKIILFLKCWRKKLGQFSKNYRAFYPKICHKTLKNMGLGSGMRKKPGTL
jgi:hypothetical protein